MRELPVLSAPAPSDERVAFVRDALGGFSTICESARCPNQGTCWSEGTATFLLAGDTCTRGCRFCHVKKAARPPPPEADEPARVAAAVTKLGLEYVVLTSVDRDDLEDRGAAHLAACVVAVRETGALVELLSPDLDGDPRLLETVLAAGPDVFAHNIETVARLTSGIRDRRAGYARSLDVLRTVKEIAPDIVTKSSLMLGLGETDDEAVDTLIDLRTVDVDIVTVGQYLRPSPRAAPVMRYADMTSFEDLASDALALGFAGVAAGPLVRSSFHAAVLYAAARAR